VKFEELKKFITEDMQMAPGFKYQPIMIRTLIKAKNGEATKEEIKDAIREVNHHKLPRNDTKYPWDILTKKHKVAEYDTSKKVYRLLDFDTYYPGTKAPITKLCDEKINQRAFVLIRHKPKSDWKDELGVEYPFNLKTVHYSDNLIPGAKTIWFDRKGGKYNFWGYGDVSALEELGNNECVAQFKQFISFEKNGKGQYISESVDRKINRKMKNIRDSIIVIDEKIYDKIINPNDSKYEPPRVKRQKKISEELVAKTIAELPDLIRKFDKNKQYFRSSYDTQNQRNVRHNFISRFPPNKNPKLKLDEYVAGKPDPETEDVNRETFCWWIEHGTGDLGNLGVYGGKETYGILYKKEKKAYEFGKRVKKANFKSMEDAVDAIKAEITSVIKAGDLYTWRRDQHGRAEKTAEELVNRINGKDMFLMSHVHLRILFLYFPDIFFGITAMKPLRNCMTILGFQKNEIPKSAIRMQIMLIAEKNTHPIMKKWNNYDYSHFLYQIHRKTLPEADSQQEDILELDSVGLRKIITAAGVQN